MTCQDFDICPVLPANVQRRYGQVPNAEEIVASKYHYSGCSSRLMFDSKTSKVLQTFVGTMQNVMICSHRVGEADVWCERR